MCVVRFQIWFSRMRVEETIKLCGGDVRFPKFDWIKILARWWEEAPAWPPVASRSRAPCAATTSTSSTWPAMGKMCTAHVEIDDSSEREFFPNNVYSFPGTDFGLYRDRRAESNLKDAWHAILHRIHICHIYHPVFQHCDIYTLLSNDIELAWHTMLVCHSTNLFGFSSMIVTLARQPLIVQQSNDYMTKCSKISTSHSLELV